MSEEELLGYGIPAEWLADVRRANEDTLLELADHLPSEAAEALLDLATGVAPKVARPVAAGADPFAHPDAQRRFRVMANVEELGRALDYPWDKWTIFLHPAQRALVERDYSGPARVAGSAGTGKTIVALHRAVFLTRANPDARVLLTTFSDALSNALMTKLRGLISNQPRLGERLEVHSMNAIGRRRYEVIFGRPQIASRETIRELLKEAAGAVEGNKFSLHFLLTKCREQVLPAFLAYEMGAGGGCVAIGLLGVLPRRCPAGAEDAVAGSSTHRALVGLRAVAEHRSHKGPGDLPGGVQTRGERCSAT